MSEEIFLARPTPPPASLVKKTRAAQREERASLQSFEQTLKEQEKKQQIDSAPIPLIGLVPPSVTPQDSGQAVSVKPEGDTSAAAVGAALPSGSAPAPAAIQAAAAVDKAAVAAQTAAAVAAGESLPQAPEMGAAGTQAMPGEGQSQPVPVSQAGEENQSGSAATAPQAQSTRAAVDQSGQPVSARAPEVVKAESAAAAPAQASGQDPVLSAAFPNAVKKEAQPHASLVSGAPVRGSEGTESGSSAVVYQQGKQEVLLASQAQVPAVPVPEGAKQPQESGALTQPAQASSSTTSDAGELANNQPASPKVTLSSAGQKNANAGTGEENSAETANPKTVAEKPGTQTAYAADQARFPAEVLAASRPGTLEIGKPNLPVIQQVVEKLEEAVQQGRTSLRMQLNPKDLGAIDVRLVSSGGSVSVTIIAEQPSTGQLLEKQMDQLRASLAGAGINLANVNIGHQAANGQQGSAFSDYPAPERFMEGGAETANPQAELSPGPYTNRASTESRIDYRI